MVTLEEIRQARAELPPAIVRTPLLASEALSDAIGAATLFLCPKE